MRAEIKPKLILNSSRPYWSRTFVRVWSQWTIHVLVCHPLIFSSVSGTELVAVSREVNVTLKLVEEWHGEHLYNTGSDGECNT